MKRTTSAPYHGGRAKRFPPTTRRGPPISSPPARGKRFTVADGPPNHSFFWKVHLNNGKIDVALTATTRTGFHQSRFNNGDEKISLILDLTHRDKLLNGTIFKISDTRIAGLRQSERWARNQKLMYVIDFSRAYESCISATGEDLKNNVPVSGTSSKAAFTFFNNGPLYVKVSLSVVSVEGAIKNMEAENPGWDFEQIRKNATDAWQKELSKIEITGGSED